MTSKKPLNIVGSVDVTEWVTFHEAMQGKQDGVAEHENFLQWPNNREGAVINQHVCSELMI